MGDFMDTLIKQLPPVKPELHKDFSTDQMTIIQTKHVFPDVGCFDCYQFVLPYANFPPTMVEKYKYTLESCKIFPINPEQPHQLINPVNNDIYNPVFINRKLLQDIAHSLFGIKQVRYTNKSIKPSSQLMNLFRLFVEESKHRPPGYNFVLQGLQMQIIVHLLRELESNLPGATIAWHYTDRKSVRLAVDFMNEHYRENFSLEDVAGMVNYSPYHFTRIFKAETGQTPFQYLLDIKINRAKELLAERRDLTITDVCHLCGFNSLSHFTAVFKRRTGVTPTRYRESF